jgi:hypothetical protein
LKSCRERGYKNIGVLKFRVKVGKEEPSLTVEPLCSNLAERLENLLIVLNNPKEPLGILHAPGEVASAKDTRSTYRTAEGRKQLLSHTYPLAWGKDKVKADAFLTGLVEIQADLRKALVTLEVFDRDKGPEKLLTFSVEVDRAILADLGLHFALDLPDLKRATPSKLDQRAIARAVAKLRELDTRSRLPRGGLVQLTFVVGDKVQEIRPSERRGGEGLVRAPEAGQQLVVKVKNVSKQRLGLVLKVAGRSTVDEEIEVGFHCKKWLLDPGNEYTLKGYYMTDSRSERQFKAPDWSARSELAVAADDLIEVAVFVSGKMEDVPSRISLRGLSPRAKKARSLKDLQKRLMARTGLKRTLKGIIVADDTPVEPAKISREAMPNPTFLEYRRVRLEPPAPAKK